MRSIWQRSLGHRLSIILAFAMLALELVYVTVSNGLLWTGTLEKLANDATPGIHMQIGSAWTFWPGTVHGKNVAFRFEDRNVQFYVTLDSVVLDIRLWQLPGKTFHATRARGEGAHYWMLHKVDPAKSHERRVAHYPKIPGFPHPPLITKPQPKPVSDKKYNLWTVQFDDVDVGLRELWILEARYRGEARASGGFYLQPGRDVMTDACRLIMKDGTLEVGRRTLASGFGGTLDAQLHRHDPREIDGAMIFSKISLKTQLDGSVPDLTFAELYLQPESPRVVAGHGTLRMRTELREGQWVEGSYIAYETDALSISQDGAKLSGPIALRAAITQVDPDSQVRLTLESGRVSAEYEGALKGLAGPTARDLKLVVGATADLTKDLRWVSVSADLKLALPNLRWLNKPLAASMFTAGRVDARLHLEWSEGRASSGKVSADLKDVTLSVADQPVNLSGSLIGDATYDNASEHGRFSRLQLELPEFISSNVPIPGGMKAHSDLEFWGLLPPKRLLGKLTLESATLDPLMPLVIPSDILRGLAKVLVNLGKTRVVLDFEHSGSAYELQLAAARSGDVQAFGALRKTKLGKGACGQFYVDGKVGMGLVVVDGDTELRPLVSQEWWRERPDMMSWCSTATPSKRRKVSRARAQ